MCIYNAFTNFYLYNLKCEKYIGIHYHSKVWLKKFLEYFSYAACIDQNYNKTIIQ